jgi:FtsP/CotA-like multicopper oxidase with cupredoxin domain
MSRELESAMHSRAMIPRSATALAGLLLLVLAGTARAAVDGIPVSNGAVIPFTAKTGHIETPDGGSLLLWGYAHGGGNAQYPGPTLIVDQGSTFSITLTNELPMPVSIVFPGHSVVATGGLGTQDGLLTKEALPAGGVVTYQVTATHAGTYTYHSGTRPELQVEMGLVGAIIVRPTGFNPASPRAYAHADTSYDRENLYLLTDIDPVIHDVIEFQGLAALDAIDRFTGSFAVYWFINGRAAPDTMLPSYIESLPHQPYSAITTMHPGERVLMRVVGGGKDIHPFHHHGNHARVVARDGRVLESAPGVGPDLAYDVFTIQSVPGETVDAIFEWTAEQLGWDIYGTGPDHAHTCSNPGCPDTTPVDGRHDVTGAACFDQATKEYCPDHGKAFPVTLPGIQDLTIGFHYSGSPFMGVTGILPPGQTNLNPNAGFAFMWHSHVEKEIVNFDIFPGGMMTMLIVEPHVLP